MRLTKKELMNAINQPMCFGSRLVGKKMFAQIIEELCEYKSIEEKFGIDLITLFKILEQDWIYRKNYYPDKIIKCWPKGIEEEGIRVLDEDEYYMEDTLVLEYEEFGKTWALTKEELL